MALAILVVDVYTNIEFERGIKIWESYPPELVTDSIDEFLQSAQTFEYPIYATQHTKEDRRDQINNRLLQYISNPLINKRHEGAFTGTILDKTLNEKRISELFILGYHRDHCVYETIKEAIDRQYDVSTCKRLLLTSNKKYDRVESKKFIMENTNFLETLEDAFKYLKERQSKIK